MKKGFGLITALLTLTIAFCVNGTVMSKERDGCTRENERYAALEGEFLTRTRQLLEEEGYHDCGVTITWTREGSDARRYLVEIHHRGIGCLDETERERLSESLRGGGLTGEAEEILIIYI